MNRKLLTIAGMIAAVLIAGAVGYYLPRPTPSAPQPQATAAPPQATPEENPTVELPADKQKLIGVRITAAAVMPLKETLRMTGRIEYDEQRLATVNTKLEGWIERLYVDYTGRTLKKGEPLCELYSPEFLAAQQELIDLAAWDKSDATIAHDAERLAAAARQRLRLWDMTPDQIRHVESTGTPIRTITILSPVSGTAVQKYAVQGQRIMAGERLFDLADLSTVWLVAEANTSDIARIRPGQRAVITIDGRIFTAPVAYIYPTLNAETRTTRIRFTIANPSGALRPQTYANVELDVDLGRRLAVPADAVIDTGERTIVYVDKGDETFEPRVVTAGLRAGGYREITRGLKEGERVASSATFLVDSEAQLKGVQPLAR